MEIAQLEKSLLHKNRDLGSDPWCPHKKLWEVFVIPAVERQSEGSRGLMARQSSQSVSSRFKERPWLTNRDRLRKTAMSTPASKHICTYVQVHPPHVHRYTKICFSLIG